MKVFSRFVKIFACALSILAVNNVYANGVLEPVISLDGSSLQVNKNHEMVFAIQLPNYEYNLCYSNIDLAGETLNLSKIIGEQLLELGFNPKSIKSECLK
ncbi:MAG: hypothetical protein H0U27_02770 [Nitrosopumilus sp.]|nr:hypothetical protein [Nitrosopumilus sp.]